MTWATRHVRKINAPGMMGREMTMMWAAPHQLEIARSLFAHGRRRQVELGAEDLAAAVARGQVLLGTDDTGAWGAIAVIPEAGAAEPAAESSRRVYLRGAAFRGGVSPSRALCDLFDFYRRQERRQPELIVAHGGDVGHHDGDAGWYPRTLRAAGFQLAERVVFFELTNLPRRTWPTADDDPQFRVHAAIAADLDAVVAVDRAAFAPLWRLSERDLRMLHLVGQIFVAEHDETVVAYLAQTSAGATAQLARLAVLPQFGGQGIGRRLLVAGLQFGQAAGCEQAVLNTQASNELAQRLYHSLGFRRTGEQLKVFT